MADDNEDFEDDAEDTEEPKKKSPIKLILFIGLPVLILLLAGVGGFLLFAGGGDGEEHAEAGQGESGGHAGGSSAAPQRESYFFALAEGDTESTVIRTTIRSADGRPVMLQMQITLEASDPAVRPIVQSHIDPIMDQFLMFLRELREDDLYGSAGMHRVRLEMLRRVNLAIEPAQVDAVLIQEFLIVD
jgi:flagellar FliL protein